MLKKTKSVFIERNSLKIVVYAFKYLIAFGEQKMVTPETKNDGTSGHASM